MMRFYELPYIRPTWHTHLSWSAANLSKQTTIRCELSYITPYLCNTSPLNWRTAMILLLLCDYKSSGLHFRCLSEAVLTKNNKPLKAIQFILDTWLDAWGSSDMSSTVHTFACIHYVGFILRIRAIIPLSFWFPSKVIEGQYKMWYA